MGFEKFGRKSFTAMTKTAKFVDLLEEGKVEGTVCKDCGAKFFPPRADCEKCFSKSFASHPRSSFWGDKNKLKQIFVAD